jgi:muramoyltetrapeptide carboxypeptidase
MLTHFRDASVFDSLAGMVVGQLTACEPSDGITHQQMLLDLLSDHGFPVLAEVPFGHTADKLTLPIGAQVHAAADDNVLRFEFPS